MKLTMATYRTSSHCKSYLQLLFMLLSHFSEESVTQTHPIADHELEVKAPDYKSGTSGQILVKFNAIVQSSTSNVSTE